MSAPQRVAEESDKEEVVGKPEMEAMGGDQPGLLTQHKVNLAEVLAAVDSFAPCLRASRANLGSPTHFPNHFKAGKLSSESDCWAQAAAAVGDGSGDAAEMAAAAHRAATDAGHFDYAGRDAFANIQVTYPHSVKRTLTPSYNT